MYIWPAFTSAAPAWNANHSLTEAPERLDDQRRLADPGLADEQHRARA